MSIYLYHLEPHKKAWNCQKVYRTVDGVRLPLMWKGLKVMFLTRIKKRRCVCNSFFKENVHQIERLTLLFQSQKYLEKVVPSWLSGTWTPSNPPPTSTRGHQLMVRHNFAFELNNSKDFSLQDIKTLNFEVEWECRCEKPFYYELFRRKEGL